MTMHGAKSEVRLSFQERRALETLSSGAERLLQKGGRCVRVQQVYKYVSVKEGSWTPKLGVFLLVFLAVEMKRVPSQMHSHVFVCG